MSCNAGKKNRKQSGANVTPPHCLTLNPPPALRRKSRHFTVLHVVPAENGYIYYKYFLIAASFEKINK